MLIEKKRNAILLRLRVIGRLGSKCEYCGESDKLVLEIDHRKGGGNRHREEYGNEFDLVYAEINSLDDKQLHSEYQLLCANCHTRRHKQSEVGPPVDDKELHFDRWPGDWCASHPDIKKYNDQFGKSSLHWMWDDWDVNYAEPSMKWWERDS